MTSISERRKKKGSEEKIDLKGKGKKKEDKKVPESPAKVCFVRDCVRIHANLY